MTLAQFEKLLDGLLGRDRRPVVVYSGIWTLARAFDVPREALAAELLAAVSRVVGPERTLAMPTFTDGYRDGRLDLDKTPGKSGAISELHRTSGFAHRTKSAFFSFAVSGPDAERLAALEPRDAWGDGSLYDWMESSNAHLVMLGVPKSFCSFIHRAEWLMRERLPYRVLKEFSGEIIVGGRSQRLTERLFVRDSEIGVENAWSRHEPVLERSGMRSVALGSGEMSEMGARHMLATLMPVLEADPYSFLKEPDKAREHYETRTR